MVHASTQTNILHNRGPVGSLFAAETFVSTTRNRALDLDRQGLSTIEDPVIKKWRAHQAPVFHANLALEAFQPYVRHKHQRQ